MSRTRPPRLDALGALLGSEGKRRVVRELAGGQSVSLAELVHRTGLGRQTVKHALAQLEEARLLTSRKERGQILAEPVAAQASLIAGLASLDTKTLDVHPVPGRLLNDKELALYEQHLMALPRAVIDEEYPEDERTVGLSAIVIGDPVE